ncbi:hypothetical protein [Sulfurospirillum halorespirans]|uniref:DUF2249 domain-containing protein n=1 Tax=Sulfurospirillum halorespirans DSM 13726 TaxID=1193502 RepID=A0A1D7TKX4_9BACT|nr:hypothetical protein [Sulfurospirillum halorespirans]AOO65574.1 hypothetical protein SHALO_1803 [Sulfurospirillum halorespirans DSM 13726]
MMTSNSFPIDATLLHVNNATVPFFTYFQEGIEFISFDTSTCVPPEPMVNAMIALELLDAPTKKVVMINHRSPVGLLAKVQLFYDIEVRELDGGKLQLIFSYKEGMSDKVDLSQKQCAG